MSVLTLEKWREYPFLVEAGLFSLTPVSLSVFIYYWAPWIDLKDVNSDLYTAYIIFALTVVPASLSNIEAGGEGYPLKEEILLVLAVMSVLAWWVAVDLKVVTCLWLLTLREICRFERRLLPLLLGAVPVWFFLLFLCQVIPDYFFLLCALLLVFALESRSDFFQGLDFRRFKNMPRLWFGEINAQFFSNILSLTAISAGVSGFSIIGLRLINAMDLFFNVIGNHYFSLIGTKNQDFVIRKLSVLPYRFNVILAGFSALLSMLLFFEGSLEFALLLALAAAKYATGFKYKLLNILNAYREIFFVSIFFLIINILLSYMFSEFTLLVALAVSGIMYHIIGYLLMVRLIYGGVGN